MSQPARARVSARPRGRTPQPLAPRGPRRVSGPVRRPVAVPGGAAALPSRRVAAPVRREVTAVGRLRALSDHKLLDGLLRSRAWICIIALALGGVVAMQVSLLKLNSGIGRAVETASTLERQNAALESSVARMSSGQAVDQVAANAGMIVPKAGDVKYVRTRGGADARWALRHMGPPTDAARALMANRGVVPGSLMAGTPGAAVATPSMAATPTTAAPTAAPGSSPVVAPVQSAAPITTPGQG